MKKQIAAIGLVLLCSVKGYGQVQHKDMGEKNPKPINSSIADSMRKVGNGLDSNVDLMYNKNARPMDSVPQDKHNKTIKRKRADKNREPMNKK